MEDESVDSGAVDSALTENAGPTVEEIQGNPAWGEMLSKIPSGLHQMITPYLQEWDRNFQKEQAKYAPYRSLVDSGVSPDQIAYGQQLLKVAQEDPRMIYDSLVKSYGEKWGLNPGPQENVNPQRTEQTPEVNLDDPSFDITQHPKFQELMNNQNTLAQYLANQLESQQAAEQDAQLDSDLKALTEKHGAFDEQYVMSLAANGVPLEQAVQKYHAMVNDIRSRPAPGAGNPPIVPTGGGVPSNPIDVGALSRQETRGLVQQFVKNANLGER